MTPNKLLQANDETLSAVFNFMNIIFVNNPTDLFMLNSIFDVIVTLIRENQKELAPKTAALDAREKELKSFAGQIEHQARLLQSYKEKLLEKEAANDTKTALKEAQNRVDFCQEKLDNMKKQLETRGQEFEAQGQEFEESRKKESSFELSNDQFRFLQTQFVTIMNTDLSDKERRAKGIVGYSNIKNSKLIADFLQIKGE